MEDKKLILIIDDNVSFLTLLQDAIADWGYQTETAATVSEAFSKLAKCRPALILLDLLMPHVDGIGLLQRTPISSLTGIPIVILSGVAQGSPAWIDANKRLASLKKTRLDLEDVRFMSKPTQLLEIRRILETRIKM